MGTKLTRDEYNEIEGLTEKALSAYNKKEAENYIGRIEYIAPGLSGYANIIKHELISGLKTASGRVQDKEHKTDSVRASLFKLEGQIEG